MDLPELDPVIHQAARLRIMTLLYENRQAALAWVREATGLTPGNLDSHVRTLEEAGYARRTRTLVGSGFEVRLRITDEGDQAYERYLDDFETYLSVAEPDGEDEDG